MDRDTLTSMLRTLEYGPAPEQESKTREWLKGHGAKFQHYIDGRWQEPAGGGYFATINPARSEEVLASIALGTQPDVDAAVAAAAKAFPAWSALPGHERARYLYAIARTVAKHARVFAVLESLDNGKPIRETRDIDVPVVIRHFYYHAGWAQTLEREFAGYRPGGVVAQIIPWNFPFLMLAWKIAPAIAAGNTVVLKPSKSTPLTALLLSDLLMREVGLPPGVVNIVTGDSKTGTMLYEHPVPWKVTFTGSTEVGRVIRKGTAGSRKHLTMELGGKSPFIVFENADLDSAIEGVVNGIWFNGGQVCCAGSRLLVQEGIHDDFIRRLKRRMAKLRVGDPLDKTMDMGAINNAEQLKKITELMETGRKEGATQWQPENVRCPRGGFFLPPTLFTGVQPSHTIAQEEIFGPVLVTLTFRTPSEAVQLANNTRYGLAASIWSQDIDTAMDVARKVKAGTVWINSTNLFDAAAGFGGYRESGYGREGGREGMYDVLVEAGHDGAEVAAEPPPVAAAVLPSSGRRLTGPTAFLSVASWYAPTRQGASPSMQRTDRCSGRWGTRTGRTYVTPSKPRGTPFPHGSNRPPIFARRSSTSGLRTSPPKRTVLRPRSRPRPGAGWTPPWWRLKPPCPGSSTPLRTRTSSAGWYNRCLAGGWLSVSANRSGSSACEPRTIRP